MSISQSGLVGAFGGLLLGLAQFVLAMAVMRRVALAESEEGEAPPAPGVASGRLRVARNALAGFSFLALPALGYVLGTTLTHQGGVAR